MVVEKVVTHAVIISDIGMEGMLGSLNYKLTRNGYHLQKDEDYMLRKSFIDYYKNYRSNDCLRLCFCPGYAFFPEEAL